MNRCSTLPVKRIRVAFHGAALAIALAALCPAFGCSMAQASGMKEAAADSLPATPRSWYALPNVFYTPETGFGGGLAGGYFFSTGQRSRPSSVQAAVSVTEREQFLAELYPELHLDGGAWRVRLEVSAKDYPDVFYGIGPDTREEDEESYASRGVGAVLVGARRLREALSVGLRLRFLDVDIEDVEAGTLLDLGEVPGSDGGTVSGLGPVVTWDTRNNVFYTTSGALAEFYAIFCQSRLGSDYEFTRFVADLRGFVPLSGSQALGLHAYSESVFGDAPFFALPTLGGHRVMRGYREGRFRDDFFAAAQVEYRFPVWSRVRGAVFACIGGVAGQNSGPAVDDLEYSAGVGLRYRLSAEGTHVRIDYALGREGGALYLTVGEAF